MMRCTTHNFLLSLVCVLVLSFERHFLVVTVTANTNDQDATATSTHSTTSSSIRRLRQKMVIIPDLFDMTPIPQDHSVTTTSSSEWYDSNHGFVTHSENEPKELPSLFNKYRNHHPLSTIHTNAKKYNDENLLLEMEIFERLLQDSSSMSLSMPTQPIVPTPNIITPPSAPSPVKAPTIISPLSVPSSPSMPTAPSAPTPVVVVPSPGVVTPSSVPPPPNMQPVTAPSTKGKDPNGMMSSSKSSAPSNSKVVAPSTPTSKVPSSKGGAESPSSIDGPTSKGQPSSPSSKGMDGAPSTTPPSKGEPNSKGEPSSPSSKGMSSAPSTTPSPKGEPSSKSQPPAPTSKSMAGAPSTLDTEGPTPLLGSKGGPATSSPFSLSSSTPSTLTSPVGSTPVAPDESTPTTPVGSTPTTPVGLTPTAPVGSTPTAPVGSTPAAPVGSTPTAPEGSTPTVSSPSIFEGEGSMVPIGSDTSSREAMIMSKCGVSESDRSQAILGDVSTVSPLSELVDEASVAHTALIWLDKEDDLIVCSDGSRAVVQRYVLAMFYFSMNGFEWSNCRASSSEVAGPCIDGKPWLDSSHECEWYGIECDTNSTVTKLTLKANNLVGVLPDELFFLSGLVGLSLDHNMFIGGEIPEAIGKLTQLTYVELDENFLGGSIPDSLYTISTLQAIDLNGNKLMGTISESIMNLPSLAVFQIEDNLFEGALPTGLASLEELLVLYVHGNNFTGTSLQHICALMDSRRQTNVAYLQFLTADCKDSTKVECTCCDCF